MDAEWTASALFSPSKARVQQAQAKDWAAIEAWIAKKYGSRVPPFERNEDTLQALLTLANLNESADEQRNQIERIEKAALASLSRKQGGLHDEVLQVLQTELANETHLDTLAETAVALECASMTTQNMARDIVLLNTSEFEMRQQLSRVEQQLTALQSESRRMQTLLQELARPEFEAPSDIVDNTTEWTRTAKTLKAKVIEYEERLAATRPPTSTNSLKHVYGKAMELQEQQQRLLEIENELREFRELPSEPRQARARLEEARDQLRTLTTKRDHLFEELAKDG
ncbi:putative HAUS augmin-like complex subunit 1 [Septoria linicola]|nr:putative HAUS augmin-like complex subunit 1 [Septoria linicola]